MKDERKELEGSRRSARSAFFVVLASLVVMVMTMVGLGPFDRAPAAAHAPTANLTVPPTLGSPVLKTNVPEVTICTNGTTCDISGPVAAWEGCSAAVTPFFACAAATQVTVQVHGFPAGSEVHVWWLRAMPEPRGVATSALPPEEIRRYGDCSQTDGALDNPPSPAPSPMYERTHLGDITLGASTDHGSLGNVALPPGNHLANWVYGINWVCATTAPHPGGSGPMAEHPFVVLPVPVDLDA